MEENLECNRIEVNSFSKNRNGVNRKHKTIFEIFHPLLWIRKKPLLNVELETGENELQSKNYLNGRWTKLVNS